MVSIEGSDNNNYNATPDKVIQSLLEASQSWEGFDLTSRKSNLATSVIQTKENREASLVARKNLSEITKAFKKDVKSLETVASVATNNTKASEIEEVTNLLAIVAQLAKSCRSTVKSYQEEIDNLTRRCKASDTFLLDLANPIQSLPDPGSIMKNASLHLDSKTGQVTNLLKGMEEMHQEMELLKQKKDSEIESLKTQHAEECLALENQLKEQRQEAQHANNREEKEELIELRKEVAEYEVEFRSLKNQDITIKKLKNQIEEMTTSHEELLNSELEKLREEVQVSEGQRVAKALEREAELERKLQSMELELKSERAGREATQTHLLEADEGANKREVVWEAQRQIILKDADRLREALHEVTREKNELTLQVETLKDKNFSGKGETSTGDETVLSDMVDFQIERKAYENEINELGLTVSSLKDELHAKDEKLLEIQNSMQEKIDNAHKEQTRMQNEIATLSRELEFVPSMDVYEEMKRELRILKKLEYNAGDNDGDDEIPVNSIEDNGDESTDLEAVLIAKLRKAESDLLKERREKVEQTKECEEMRKNVVKLEKDKKQSDELVSRLEADLERVIESAKKEENAQPEKKTEVPLVTSSNPDTLQKLIDPMAPPLPTPPPMPATPEPTINTESTMGHSVETIIMAQRDRLRARCDLLEAERDGFKRELQVQVSATEQLTLDNSKLYEKVRYLQSYNGSNNSMKNKYSKTKLNDKDLDLEALEQKYEASVDPFRQFSRAERQRKINEMSSIERIVFIFAKTLLGNKSMRKVLFFYMLSMHMLVFFTTYHISHEVACQTHMIHHDASQTVVDFDPVREDIAAAKAAIGNSH